MIFQVKRDVNTGEIIEFREIIDDIAESQSTVFFNNRDPQEKSNLDTGILYSKCLKKNFSFAKTVTV